MSRGRSHAAVVHLHASPMTAALTWSLRLDERRDARSASAQSQAQHPPAGTRASFDRQSATDPRFPFFPLFRLTRETLPDDRHRTPLIAAGPPRSRPSSSPSSSSSTRATTLNPHGPAAGADEALPLGVAARNDPAGDTSARRACAMTLLRSPRIKREPVTRRPLLFSLLPFYLSSSVSSRGAAATGGMTATRSGVHRSARAHTYTRTRAHPCRRSSRGPSCCRLRGAASDVFARIMMLSLLTDRRTLSILDLGLLAALANSSWTFVPNARV